MEVSQLSHQDTHAVIGGYKPESFQVEANAEFFEMLSSTMYPNKKLAVVREVLSNSWDAHIMARKTDVPVKVTITDKEMVFQDFGPGISREKIIQNYCTYGASTKKHDGKQTGGFGLGSKAPFAYSKHFTVTSCHNGLRSIYAASRGGIETDGRPDFRAMVADLPTTDSGITVTIPVANASDKDAFIQLAKDLAFLGGINCELNGELLRRIDYSKAELPFIMLDANLIGRHQNTVSKIYVRYGAVVYPVDTTTAEFQTIIQACKYLMRALIDKHIVLLGKPDTLTPAPSRETLSYTPGTIAAIIKLLEESEDAVVSRKNDLKTILNESLFEFAVRHKTNALRIYNSARTTDDFFHVIRQKDNDFENPSICLAAKEVFNRIAASVCSENRYNRVNDLFVLLVDAKLPDRVKKHLRAKHRDLKKSFNRMDLRHRLCERFDATRMGFVTAPIWAKVESSMTRFLQGLNDRFNISVVTARRDWGVLSDREIASFVKSIGSAPSIATRVAKKLLADATIMMSPSRAAASRHLKSIGPSDSKILLLLINKKSDVDGLISYFASLGLQVFDSRAHVVKRNPPPSVPAATYFLAPSNDRLSYQACTEDNIYDPETSTATYYVMSKIAVKDGTPKQRGTKVEIVLSEPKLQYIHNYLGLDKVVMATSAIHARSLEKQGLKPVAAFFAEELRGQAKNRDKLLAYAFHSNLMHCVSQIARLFDDDNDEKLSKDAVLKVIANLGDNEAIKARDVSLLERDRMLIKFCREDANYSRSDAHYVKCAVIAKEALNELREAAKPMLANTLKATSGSVIQNIVDAFDNSWRFHRVNIVVRVAMLTAALQTAMIQTSISNMNH